MLSLTPEQWGELGQGALTTLGLTVFSLAVGFGLALLGALGRRSGNPVARAVAGTYVEALRNTPFFVQLLFLFFGLPTLGVQLTELQAAALAMTLNLGAYATEIVRAGLDAVPRGQVEAAASLGLSRAQTFWTVVLRQALAVVYPALVSQVIIVMLGSAVVSYINVKDLTYAAQFIASRNFQQFGLYLVVTAAYLALAFALRAALNGVGRSLFRFKQPLRAA
ncbi:amino acid ABC transporter permease [uncultured Deinococcus sp.]|uniref:amino acid ABC transporter permease n=1 Tax=uncultured Deinococcus sp. TaxID=158789 RepID=UPI00258C1C65|nr:amino acid ABC transporter permease [uncultured Deinococcus sp.]